jgi:hypothetical protein
MISANFSARKSPYGRCLMSRSNMALCSSFAAVVVDDPDVVMTRVPIVEELPPPATPSSPSFDEEDGGAADAIIPSPSGMAYRPSFSTLELRAAISFRSSLSVSLVAAASCSTTVPPPVVGDRSCRPLDAMLLLAGDEDDVGAGTDATTRCLLDGNVEDDGRKASDGVGKCKDSPRRRPAAAIRVVRWWRSVMAMDSGVTKPQLRMLMIQSMMALCDGYVFFCGRVTFL